MKKTIKLSLSPEAIANLKARAKLNRYMWGEDPNVSGLIEDYAMGRLDKGVNDLISQAQTSLKELAKMSGCQHPSPVLNQEFGFYQCLLCGEVWALDKDDPDYID